MISLALSVANQAMLVTTIPVRSKVYFLVAGPGNVRWGTDKAALEQGPAPGIQNGLPQNAGQGEREREWEGDLYAVSDTPGTFVIVVCPSKDHSFRKGLR